MRRGSQILFAIAFVLFLIGFGQALVSFQNTVGGTQLIAGEPVGPRFAEWILLLGGVWQALSSAALPFIGALIVDRWDRAAKSTGTEPANLGNVR
jgi:hypothetical protein